MSGELIRMQLENLANQKKIWNLFLDAVEFEDEDKILKSGNENYLMLWKNKVEYAIDKNASKDIDTSLIDGSIGESDYKVPNYYLRKGKEYCISYISNEINNLQRGIDNLNLNL